jgi:hypothetical protein
LNFLDELWGKNPLQYRPPALEFNFGKRAFLQLNGGIRGFIAHQQAQELA